MVESLAQWANAHTGDLLTLAGIMFAVVSLLQQNQRSIAVQKVELYQALETASIELFKFEAEHAETLEKFQDVRPDERKFADDPATEAGPGKERFSALQARFGSIAAFASQFPRLDPSTLSGAEARQFAAYEQERMIARKFHEQTLNLFEMATRFRNKRIIEPVVFGSWVIWFYDTLVQWGFRDLWPDLRQNYTPDLRAVFNKFIAEFDPEEDDAARKQRFFKHVAEATHCPIIRDWLRQLDDEAKQFRFETA